MGDVPARADWGARLGVDGRDARLKADAEDWAWSMKLVELLTDGLRNVRFVDVSEQRKVCCFWRGNGCNPQSPFGWREDGILLFLGFLASTFATCRTG